MRQLRENLYDAYAQDFNIDQIYFEQKTEHQHLLIFHNAIFGRVMALDGIIQTTEKDEFIYHEMLTHVPVLAHGKVKSLLIIGGGDGGMLREVCRHQGIERIVQVEIDAKVIEMCRQFLPDHSQGAFDDARVEIVIDDGLKYLLRSGEQFDVIISDSTDPIGPGEVLFTAGFYQAAQRRLREGGVLVAQNGVAFMQIEEVRTTARRLAAVFKDYTFYGASVPTYVGGVMTFVWATDNLFLRQTKVEVLRERFLAAGIKTRYYNPQVHVAAFALPQYLLEAIGAT